VGVLALPATAIRRVNAGLVVGNPVGSTNTRAKALTSAELKAIIEASGISYLPSSGGTLMGGLSLGANALTCGAITSAGNLAIRDGLNAMQAEVFGTYTSATSFESLCLKATASAMQIGSAIGSAGGTNRPLQLGHFNSGGTFTSGLSVATNGDVTMDGKLILDAVSGRGWDAPTGTRVYCASMHVHAGFGLWCRSNGSSDTTQSGMDAPSNLLTLYRAGSAVLQFAATNDAVFTANVTLVPVSSVTLSTNGQFSVEMTSNTAGNLVYRGSDGTTRRMALTFS
jgi:hypothetical protein